MSSERDLFMSRFTLSLLLHLLLSLSSSTALLPFTSYRRQSRHFLSSSLASSSSYSHNAIDYQSDSNKYGRGEMHLSAAIEVGDVVVYQSGTWYVDGVEVGDGINPATYNYARVDFIQVVWTHNCEHGVIGGFKLEQAINDKRKLVAPTNAEDEVEIIEFGPEQLVARIPVKWEDEDGKVITAETSFDLNDQLWENDNAEF